MHRIDASQAQSCKGCTITLTKVATLGRIEDDELPGVAVPTSGFAVDSKGQFYTTSMDVEKILVYDHSGKFLRTIGRKGNGPAEFTNATKLTIGPGDSIHVLDGIRITTLTPQEKYARTVTLPYPRLTSFVAFPNGDFGLIADPQMPNAKSLMVISAKGKTRPVGSSQVSPIACLTCGRLIGPSRTSNQMWTMPTNSYSLEAWNSDGLLIHQVSVTGSPWFTEWTTPASRPDMTLPAKSTTRDISEDTRGRLWVMGTAAGANWKPIPAADRPEGFGKLNIPRGGAAPSRERIAGMMSVIDVLDLSTNRVFVSQRFNGRILRMISPEYFLQAYEDTNGIPVVDIFRAEIRTP